MVGWPALVSSSHSSELLVIKLEGNGTHLGHALRGKGLSPLLRGLLLSSQMQCSKLSRKTGSSRTM